MDKPKSSPHLSDAAQAVIAFIEQRKGGVSMVEIERELSPLIPTRGHYAWEIAPNVAFWLMMSEEWCEVMHEVKASGRVEIVPTSPLVYFIDGKVWQVPIAKRLTKAGYKTQRWLPICFNPVGA